MAVSTMGVWLSLQNSAVLRLVHSVTRDVLAEVNTAPAVTKMLSSECPPPRANVYTKCVLKFLFVPSGCDDIIRQHKAACLRVTSLLAVKDLLWIGTSAGVVLTMTIPAVVANTGKLVTLPVPIGQLIDDARACDKPNTRSLTLFVQTVTGLTGPTKSN